MSRLIFPCLISILFAMACAPRSTEKAPARQSSPLEKAQTGESQRSSPAQYKASLDALPKEAPSSLSGLDLFDEFASSDPAVNDSLFKTYLEFQARLIEDINANLPDQPHFEQINSLVWADTTQHEREGKAYEAALKMNGLLLKSTEGVVYVDRDPAFIKPYFYDHLTKDSRKFFDQLSKETQEPFSEDGGFVITNRQLADRVGFWDGYISSTQARLFLDEARARRDVYRYFLFAGMDNTPAFDYETGALSPEFSDALNYYVNTYPSTESADVVREYIALLKETGNKTGDRVEEFLERYR